MEMLPGRTGRVSNNFWKNKKVFLTGHTGFKGGWMSIWLQILGAEVIGYSLEPSTKRNFFDVARVGQNMHSIIGDIRDADKLSQRIKACSPEIVFHMAAQPLVRESYLNPMETYSTNIMGTLNLFEAVRSCDSVRAVVNITSDKCYQNNETFQAYKETDPMGGYDPYSNSKGCAELITSSYRDSFFYEGGFNSSRNVAIASVRAGNVIGGGDWSKDRLIPDILESFEKNMPVVIRNPNSIRPWQHVLEPLGGYLKLAERLYVDGNKFSTGWNFGPTKDCARTVEWIVEYMRKTWGNQPEYILDANDNPHEANLLLLDITKAKELLGWKPKLNIEQAIEKIIVWHKEYLHASDMHIKSQEEIKEFITQENL